MNQYHFISNDRVEEFRVTASTVQGAEDAVRQIWNLTENYPLHLLSITK